MPRLIETDTRLEAWAKGVDYLRANGSTLNLLLSIKKPWNDGPIGKLATDQLNQLYRQCNEYPINTVAETLFPAWEYRKRGLENMRQKYLEEYDQMKKVSWGAYAERLLRRQNGQGAEINPLDELITKMRSEISHSKKGAFKSCYEINVAENDHDIPIYRPSSDGGRRRGGPCLSHLSFKYFGKRVHLTAIYRSHDYFNKVPGNLLGLARLQHCVAQEIGKPMGTLVVHSTYAYISSHKRRLAEIAKESMEKLSHAAK